MYRQATSVDGSPVGNSDACAALQRGHGPWTDRTEVLGRKAGYLHAGLVTAELGVYEEEAWLELLLNHLSHTIRMAT